MIATRVPRPWLMTASTGLGILLALIGLAMILRLVLPMVPVEVDGILDFDLYAAASQQTVAGYDPYAEKLWMDEAFWVGYVYPPLLAWILAPLVTLMPVRTGYFVWFLLELSGFVGCVLLALRAGARPVAWHWTTLVVGAALLPFVVRDNLFHGQPDFLLLLLITAGLWLLSRGRQVEAGVLLAVAANGKPFLAILLLYLAWRMRWRAFFTMGFTGAALLALTFLPLVLGSGLAPIQSWMDGSHEMASAPFIGFRYNHALYGLLVRLFTPTPWADPWVLSPALLTIGVAAITAVPLATWLLAVPMGRRGGSDDVLVAWSEAGLLLTLMFAAGPMAEANHLLVLVTPAIAAIRLGYGAADPAQRRRWQPAAYAWIAFLVVTAAPLRTLSWTDWPDAFHPTGLAVLLTGKLGFLLLVAGIATAWSLAQEYRSALPLGAPLARIHWPATRTGTRVARRQVG